MRAGTSQTKKERERRKRTNKTQKVTGFLAPFMATTGRLATPAAGDARALKKVNPTPREFEKGKEKKGEKHAHFIARDDVFKQK